MSAIEKFINRTTAATNANSKEIRMQIADAEALMAELAVIGCRNADLADQMIALQQKLIADVENIHSATSTTDSSSVESTLTANDFIIDMDGGSFKS